MRFIVLLVLSLSSFVAACCKNPDPAPTAAVTAPATPPTAAPAPTAAAKVTNGAPNAGGLTWTAPAPFVSRIPESRMREAEYVVSAEAGGEPAVMGVFFFGVGQGGAVDANVERWIGQFTDPKGRPIEKVAKVDKRTVNGMAVTIVDVTGTYTNGMPGASAGPQSAQRMLSAIVEGPNGLVFFKFVGAVDAVEKAEEAFEQLVASIKPAA